MTNDAFFDVVRRAFGSLSQKQVDGCNVLLEATAALLPQQRAYILATAWHETAATMQPIHERGPKAYFDKYKPGTALGRTLGNTLAGDGFRFRGRGYVQLTGRTNYVRAGRILGLDLVKDPELAFGREIAGRIIVAGMMQGWFTGRSLQHYVTASKIDYVQARRVVNGLDGAHKIAGHAVNFERALAAACTVLVAAVPAPPTLTVEPGETLPNGLWGRLWERVFG